MGYYIETGSINGKAQWLVDNHNAKLVSRQEFLAADVNANGLIVVVNNSYFEAAAFCYDDGERQAFTDPADHRYKTYVIMDRILAEKLTGYVIR